MVGIYRPQEAVSLGWQVLLPMLSLFFFPHVLELVFKDIRLSASGDVGMYQVYRGNVEGNRVLQGV